MKKLISNSRLKLKNIPEPDADLFSIGDFALTYDGNVEAGSADRCTEIARERRAETLDDLRTCLFMMQRSWHHGGWAPQGTDETYMRDLVRQIREKVATQELIGKKGLPRFWWAALPCIPPGRNSPAYARLRTIWGDQTRFRGRDDKRYAEFVNPAVETNFTVTLWENFSLFPAATWVTALAETCGLGEEIGKVSDCRWSYGWSSPKTTESPSRICDLVLHFRDEQERDGLLIVEAKRPGGTFGEKDLSPATYLDLAPLRETSHRRWLVYCVDDAQATRVREQVDSNDKRWVVLTWQKLAALQIGLVGSLGLAESVRAFVAGAIQYQFAQHGIRPSRLAEGYLETEPAMEEMDAQADGQGLKEYPPSRDLWRLPKRR